MADVVHGASAELNLGAGIGTSSIYPAHASIEAVMVFAPMSGGVSASERLTDVDIGGAGAQFTWQVYLLLQAKRER